MKNLPGSWFLIACLVAALAQLLPGAAVPLPKTDAFPGWPTQFEGRPLTALALTPVETRFQQSFPGRVGRFTDGQREIIIRWVGQGTRKLHASGDCFKAIGYQLTAQPVSMVGQQRWSGFTAVREGERFAVRERIHDGDGGQWSDVSAWYWAVQLGRTSGPWWAFTVADNISAKPEQVK